MSTGQGQKVPPKKNWFFRKDSGSLRKENAFYEQGREPSGKKMQFTNRVGSPPERKCILRTDSGAVRKKNPIYEQDSEKNERTTNRTDRGQGERKKMAFLDRKKIHGKKLEIRIKKIENTNGKIRTENGKKIITDGKIRTRPLNGHL